MHNFSSILTKIDSIIKFAHIKYWEKKHIWISLWIGCFCCIEMLLWSLCIVFGRLYCRFFILISDSSKCSVLWLRKDGVACELVQAASSGRQLMHYIMHTNMHTNMSHSPNLAFSLSCKISSSDMPVLLLPSIAVCYSSPSTTTTSTSRVQRDVYSPLPNFTRIIFAVWSCRLEIKLCLHTGMLTSWCYMFDLIFIAHFVYYGVTDYKHVIDVHMHVNMSVNSTVWPVLK